MAEHDALFEKVAEGVVRAADRRVVVLGEDKAGEAVILVGFGGDIGGDARSGNWKFGNSGQSPIFDLLLIDGKPINR